jgi:uncharacterized protein YcgI (DUF1989 family)
VEGQQVADVILLNRHDLKERLSIRYSLTLNAQSNLTTGHTLYSIDCNPLATIVGDSVGRHDWGGAFCSEPLNRLRYGAAGTPNCRDNFARVLAGYGFEKADVTDGCNLNLFMNFEVRPDGSRGVGLPFSAAGDYFDLRAEMDLLVAVSACPQELNPCNAYNPTPVRAIAYQPGA